MLYIVKKVKKIVIILKKKVKLNKMFIWKMKKKIKMKESKYTFVLKYIF